MAWYITSINPRGGRQICPVAFTDQAEAEMFAAIVAFASTMTSVAVEEMETPSEITPVPAVSGLGPIRKKGK